MFFFDIDAQKLLLLIACGIVAHGVWIALSLKLPPLFLLAVGFAMIAPFTAAVHAKDVIVELKYGRIYIALLMVVAGVISCLWSRRFGKATSAFIGFYSLLLVGCLYSLYPGTALMYKSIGLCGILAGAFMGLTLRDFHQFRQGMRLLLLVAIVWAILFLYQVAISPTSIGRLDAFGMNPNAIGGQAAGCCCVAFFLGLYDRARLMRLVGLVTAMALLLVVLYTGSRASFGALVLAACIMATPLVRRPLVLLVVALFLAAAVTLVLQQLDIASASRMADFSNSREGVWSAMLEQWQASPLFGVGTIFTAYAGYRTQWNNAHSIYLQVLVEIGIVGMLVFMCYLFYTAIRALKMIRSVRAPEKWLAIAFLAMALGIGLFEGTPLMGTALPSIFWGLAIGLVDRLPALAASADVPPGGLPAGVALTGDLQAIA